MPQNPPGNIGAENGDSSPEVQELLSAQLQQEQQGRKDFIEAITERDERIDALTELLTRAREDIKAREEAADDASAQIAALRAEKSEAINACREALQLAHPGIPADLIRGETAEELNASVQSGQELVDRVRLALQAERDATRVPAGAPVNSGPDLEGLSPREKIASGISSRK